MTASQWLALLIGLLPGLALAGPRVVAAERVYADIARQVAGPDADVVALLTNPALDPHEFEPTPSAARAVAGAQITIENGLGYDTWMDRLLSAAPGGRRIVVGTLLGRTPGDNPHLWYDPTAMPALARAVADALAAADPAHAAGYAARCRSVLASLATSMQARIASLRAQFGGVAVAATEPVFGAMEDALGLKDSYARFELSQMNGTEPRASDVAMLQDDLRARRVRVVFTDAQAAGPATQQVVEVAAAAGVPIVRVGETLPAGENYQAWIATTLDATANALRSRP